MGVVLQMVSQNHEMAEAGHKRLRGDHEELEHRVDAMDAVLSTLRLRVEGIAAKPTDISTATIPAKLLIAILVGSLTIAGAIWRTGDRVDDLSQKLAAESELRKIQAATFTATIEDVRKEMKLYEIKTDELKDAMLKKGVIR